MNDFGKLKKIPLSDMPLHEANDFTPWLASNIKQLSDALELKLEIMNREVPVGDFSLDLLAKDLGSSRTVIIENQFSKTNHDHLGKLLTYVVGKEASIGIWVSEEVRKEHRQVLEWLNKKTDMDFFAVVVEVLKIDDSKLAFDFKPVVFPNGWQKPKRQGTSTNLSLKDEKYKAYFQDLTDELGKCDWTISWSDWPQNRYFSSGFKGIDYEARFTRQNRVSAGIYIQQGDKAKNKKLFDALEKQKEEIVSYFSETVEWDRGDGKKRSRIAVYRDGAIETPTNELEEIGEWHIENLLQIKKVFAPKIEQTLKTIT